MQNAEDSAALIRTYQDIDKTHEMIPNKNVK